MRIDGEGCVILCFVVFLQYNLRQNENHMLWMMHMIKMIVYEGDGSQKRKQIGLTSVALSKFWPKLNYTCTLYMRLFFSIRTNVHNHWMSKEPFGPLKNSRNDNFLHFILNCVGFHDGHIICCQFNWVNSSNRIEAKMFTMVTYVWAHHFK